MIHICFDESITSRNKTVYTVGEFEERLREEPVQLSKTRITESPRKNLKKNNVSKMTQ